MDLVIFTFFGRPGNWLLLSEKKKLPPKIIFTWFGADRKLIMAKRKKSAFSILWAGGRAGGWVGEQSFPIQSTMNRAEGGNGHITTTLSPRILPSPGSLDEGDFLLSRELPCLKEPCLTQGNNLHRFWRFPCFSRAGAKKTLGVFSRGNPDVLGFWTSAPLEIN